MKAIVVGGTQRGVGKTTIAAALMLAFKRRGMRVKGFKIGSDFIDPLVHEHAIGVASENLDVYLTSERYAAERVASVADACDVCVIDGISGLYDGRDGMSEEGSTAHVAKLINAGVLLVVDCNAMARSIAAMIKGYREFDPDLDLIGVVFNKTGGDAHTIYLKDSLSAAGGGVEVFGGVPKDANAPVTGGSDGGAADVVDVGFRSLHAAAHRAHGDDFRNECQFGRVARGHTSVCAARARNANRRGCSG